jgi:hypothetical protein
MGGVGIHSYYGLEKLAADRPRELLRYAKGHQVAAELRQPWTPKLTNWWAAARRGGRLRGRATLVTSATVAIS